MKHEERHDQKMLIRYIRAKYPGIITIISPIHKFAGSRGACLRQGKIQKDMGYMPGTPDIFIPWPCGTFHGLFIELKKQTGGSVSLKQRDMVHELICKGYCAVICQGYAEAVKYFDNYIAGKLKI